MVPWKLLLLKFNTDSSVLKFPKHCGILPLKLLLDKFMIWKVLILQIQGGISPVSLLFAIKRMYMDCGRIGNGCWSKLEVRSTNCKLGGVRLQWSESYGKDPNIVKTASPWLTAIGEFLHGFCCRIETKSWAGFEFLRILGTQLCCKTTMPVCRIGVRLSSCYYQWQQRDCCVKDQVPKGLSCLKTGSSPQCHSSCSMKHQNWRDSPIQRLMVE